jgi:hypothetical protein
MAPFDLGWRELQILAYVGLFGLISELWLDSARKSDTVQRLTGEVEGAESRAEIAEDEAIHATELQARVSELEAECASLRQKANTPTQTLEQVLAGLDSHLSLIGIVEKHRSMHAQGLSPWPVTGIQLVDETVIISAHIDNDADRVSGEWVSLFDLAGTMLVTGQAVPSSENQLTTAIQLPFFPEYLQDELLGNGALSPSGYTLRLTGLNLIPYSGMADSRLSSFRAALGDATRAIGQMLSSVPVVDQLQESEDSTS